MSHPVIAHLAVGSNLGDRRGAVEFAHRSIERFPGTTIRRTSRVHETDPVGPSGQGRYLNAVFEVATTLGPRELLDHCLVTERRLGRMRVAERRWGPRRLDLDVLLYGGLVIDEPGLKIPHPRMHERTFVLVPLAEIAPRLIHPVLGATIESLLSRIRSAPDPGGNSTADAVFVDRG